jgi:hypothetical protein
VSLEADVASFAREKALASLGIDPAHFDELSSIEVLNRA